MDKVEQAGNAMLAHASIYTIEHTALYLRVHTI
jgi:hypothetical protein